ncbi:hypothetical protein E0485_09430 [Paenibacillus albiflavus]|uniref:Copper amine oxidase-like N-terminal domain-containing protein n=1 Tax=Paenibacillus albiflavus TaxID=2545760 RepID=A0A4R4EHP5_9BACL|nr:hypothetical protein [Paenibacillus albiflavus]TCZ77695.1 hypothetical protein E0485_09430 [Paenibacillus albiflavus]
MKVRRIIVLTLIILVGGVTSAVADTLWGTYRDYAKVRVIVNGEDKTPINSNISPIKMDGSTMLPIDLVIDSFGPLMHWDATKQTLELNKPDVSLMIAKEFISKKDEIFSLKYPFSGVKKGSVIDFVVLVQVENLKVNWTNVEVALYSPNDIKIVYFNTEMKPGKEESFYLPVDMKNVSFEESGDYIVRVSFKTVDSDKYTVVSQKRIVSN